MNLNKSGFSKTSHHWIVALIATAATVFLVTSGRAQHTDSTNPPSPTSPPTSPPISPVNPQTIDPEVILLREQLTAARREIAALKSEVVKLRSRRASAQEGAADADRQQQAAESDVAQLRRQVLRLQGLIAPPMTNTANWNVGYIEGLHPVIAEARDYIVIDHEKLGPIAISNVQIVNTEGANVTKTNREADGEIRTRAVRIDAGKAPRIVRVLLPVVIVGMVPVLDLPDDQKLSIPIAVPAW